MLAIDRYFYHLFTLPAWCDPNTNDNYIVSQSRLDPFAFLDKDESRL